MNSGYIAERATQLQLSAISIARGMQSGAFRSSFRGHGIEFDSLRKYEPGDDIRHIDWNLMARSGKTFAKMYREERDLSIFLIADISASMNIAYMQQSPRETMLETAALLSFAGEKLHSAIGGLFFDGSIRHMLKPQQGQQACLQLLCALERYAASPHAESGTALLPALTAAAKLLHRRAFIFILSDFKVEGYEKELAILAHRHDVAAVRITAEHDETLPDAGVICFKDPETGLERLLPTHSAAFQQSRTQEAAESLELWKNTCLRSNAFPIVLPCTADPVTVLNRFFSSAKNTASFGTAGVI